ncbi:MAG TPA: malto-oligosyltrehalose trehalohydrolase [Steroidobacter sp.]|jgi:maltooligosyltrehalose trehalohydrolase|nr:malto-oligosyltrehalose trehalohydrolase [Steroidobacter sp.]
MSFQKRAGSGDSRPTAHRQTPNASFVGAVRCGGETRFRVWAPDAREVQVAVEAPAPATLTLERSKDGYFSGGSFSLPSGALYKYRVDGAGPWPDPCSRFQPQGPHGPSMIVDADAYRWRDRAWRGARMQGLVIYELHIGAFTPEGTFEAAAAKLSYLRDLGVTALEIMPLAECPGRWNWGYDGVQLFAPYHVYGDHQAFKRFVDSAHALGLAVILDVVYNHLGPDGNYLKCFSPRYFNAERQTEWGEAFNFDGTDAAGARDLVLHNVRYWASEFHVDGFRLDAAQSMFDDSSHHIVAELVAAARAAAHPREIVVIAENEAQRAEQLRPRAQGGFGLDAMWNDDFHHAARVALTGNRGGYLHDYTGRAQEFISCVRHGFLYQGQWYEWQQQPRGCSARGLPPWSFVVFTQNHDQVANTFIGDRVHTSAAPSRYRALTALMLLSPQTPLLFMGQEFASSRRFMFFADHRKELGRVVYDGRRQFVAQFRAYADEATQSLIPDPGSETAFLESKLDWTELEPHRQALQFHRELLMLRARDPVISQQRRDILEGAALSEQALALRWFDDTQRDRLLVVNLDREFVLSPASEPLLAPPSGSGWRLAWSSEDPRYGGFGRTTPVEASGRGPWRIPAQCATLLVCDKGE